MNERIEKISEQAREYADTYDDANGPIWFQMYNEKFAELIVKECVKLQHRNVIVGGGVSAYNMGRRDLAEDILKHFGVESA
jgi:hypothetical protein